MHGDEDLPDVPEGARIAGTAEWWREHMRSHLATVYRSIGRPTPNADANQDIRLLERLCK